MTIGNTNTTFDRRSDADTSKQQDELPPLSDDDRRRLLKEWADANARGDLDARRRIKAEILGHDPTGTADDGSDRGGR
jgi:hypothetical protein